MKKLILLSLLFVSFIFANTTISQSQTVYVTKSGKKYHTGECRYTSNNSVSIDLSEALDRGYEPCKVCKPISNQDSNALTGSDKNRREGIENPKQGVEKVQCSASTKSGSRCKRKTKSPNGKCWQHGGD